MTSNDYLGGKGGSKRANKDKEGEGKGKCESEERGGERKIEREHDRGLYINRMQIL